MLVKIFLNLLAKDILGESSSDGSVNRGAFTYSLGSLGDNLLKDTIVIYNKQS